MTIPNVAILLMDGHLILFHIWIQRKGITTFDKIMFDRELKEKLNDVKVKF